MVENTSCNEDIMTRESLENPLGLVSLNHISIMCRSVEKSHDFYQNILGFSSVKRPSSLNFPGAWLFKYGIGIHLLQSEDANNDIPIVKTINPKGNHISFQCESMETVESKLEEMQIKHVKSKVIENGICVNQLFFHDPDGLMIEICDCNKLPVVFERRLSIKCCPNVNCDY